ncbi:hypothetical protein C0J52_14515 [Blattella germanica]|nr:hypothetical protein C0J52_14515 [Blattella germanica]
MNEFALVSPKSTLSNKKEKKKKNAKNSERVVQFSYRPTWVQLISINISAHLRLGRPRPLFPVHGSHIVAACAHLSGCQDFR